MLTRRDIEYVSPPRKDQDGEYFTNFFNSIKDELEYLQDYTGTRNTRNLLRGREIEAYNLGEFPLKSLFKFDTDPNSRIYEFIEFDNQEDSEYRIITRDRIGNTYQFDMTDNAYRIHRPEELNYFNSYIAVQSDAGFKRRFYTFK